MTVARLLRPLCFALVALVAGCVVSPQPSPPELELSGPGIGLGPKAELVGGGMLAFEAPPGTVQPPRGRVVVTNLDATDAPSYADVQSDGSFAIAVPGQEGQVFRFQAKDGDARSEPFDALVKAQALSAASDAPACLSVAPARWLGLEGSGAERDVVLHNGCAGTVEVASPHLRRGLAGFTVFPASSVTLPAGDEATLTVRAGDGAEIEDVLLLDVTAPSAARRALTLTVPDR